MRLALLSLFILVFAPAFANETGEAPRMPTTPEEVDALFGEFWNAGDAEGLVGLYEPDAVLVGLDGTMARGTEAIRAVVPSFNIGVTKIEMNVVNVARTGEDLAVLFNHWTIRGTNEDGSPLELSGKALEVVRRQADGSWRFVFDHPAAGDGVGWTPPATAN